jgi:nucleoside-diphosphate-sugar epimerase
MTAEISPVLVTGGGGLIGRAVVVALLASKTPVRILSRSAPRSGHPLVTIVTGDITSARAVRTAMAGCSAVFHCAGEKRESARMESTNIEGTRVVFKLAGESRVSYFCHISSVGVIGATRSGMVDESSSCNPGNFYEQTKFAAEQIVGTGFEGGRAVILRPTNVFGPTTLSGWIDRPFRARARSLLNGREHAHLVYVGDVAAAALHFANSHEPKPVDTFIVSSDEESGNTVLAVQSLLASEVAGAAKPLPWSAPALMPYWWRRLRQGRSNGPYVIYSSRRLRQTGFVFPYGLARGLRDAISHGRRATESA